MDFLTVILRWSPPVLIAVAALVQLVPAVAVADARWLEKLYGVAPADETSALLLRHRAVLLGLVGVALAAGALSAQLRAPAITLGLASKLSFLVLAARAPSVTPLIKRVAHVDLVTSSLLIAAALVHWRDDFA